MARTVQGGGRRAQRSGHRVVCPECGGEFSSRGIASHRRLKHGVRGGAAGAAPARAATDAPSAAEPCPSGLAERLDALAAGLQRIEARLADLEGGALLAGGTPPAPPASELGRLRAELDEVLTHVAAKQAAASELEGDGCADAERARRTLHRELGQLRRRQLLILMRMGPDAPGAPPGWDVGGFAL